MTLPDRVEELADFQITWYVIPPSQTINHQPTANDWNHWMQVGTCYYDLFLTYANPPKGAKLYYTVLDVGTNAAEGKKRRRTTSCKGRHRQVRDAGHPAGLLFRADQPPAPDVLQGLDGGHTT